MDPKRAKVVVGAIVAAALSTFAIPFAVASSGGNGTQRDNPPSTLQLAQDEHQQDQEIENETKELREDAATVPEAVNHEHERKEARESEKERHRLHHQVRETERHADDVGHDRNATEDSIKSEPEEHQVHQLNDKVEHDQ